MNLKTDQIMVKTDCKFYMGDRPCQPHKDHKAHCKGCQYYGKIKFRILIIKLAAAGDVIRTTPLLRKIRKEFGKSEISWLTYYPELLPAAYVDNILKADTENITWLKSNRFDWLINLDKDRLAISLTNAIRAKKKSGFMADERGKCTYVSNSAERHKWLTGLWDDVSKQNSKSYLEEMFEICGYNFNGEQYIILDELTGKKVWALDHSNKIVGLNTGCGAAWASRMWPDEYWIELSEKLINKGFEVVLLGGENESNKNEIISKRTGAKYFGHFELKTFVNLVNQCDLIVTVVTMAMHIAIGLNKKVVVLNSCFNKNEFYLYNNGHILGPEINCDCYYTTVCANNCMRYLYVEKVYDDVLSSMRPK